MDGRPKAVAAAATEAVVSVEKVYSVAQVAAAEGPKGAGAEYSAATAAVMVMVMVMLVVGQTARSCLYFDKVPFSHRAQPVSVCAYVYTLCVCVSHVAILALAAVSGG